MVSKITSCHVPASQKDIQLVEARLGVAFPKAVVDLFSQINGGAPDTEEHLVNGNVFNLSCLYHIPNENRIDTPKVKDGVDLSEWWKLSDAEIHTATDDWDNLLQSNLKLRENADFPHNYIAFGEDGTSGFYAFSVEQHNFGAVYLIYIDGTNTKRLVANSVLEFMGERHIKGTSE